MFHIHDCCGDYAYDAAEGKGDVIKEEYFENCEWHIRALFEGERKMEDNQAKCEDAGRSNVCVSYHALSEDWSEIADRTINHKSDMSEYNKVIQIEPQHDQFDDVRMEYAQMLKQQLAKGNNGLVRTKYITFSIEAKSVREAKPRLERIETDILNNFKVLGVKAIR